MVYTHKLNISKNLLILIFLVVCIPITFFYMFIGDFPYLVSISKDYVSAESSIFLPFLSSINLFWFLPNKIQFIQISSGFLIDIIIITNFGALVERSAYQYYLNVCLEEDYQESFDSGFKNQFYDLYQGSVILFGLREESKILFNEEVLTIKSKKNQSLVNKSKDFYYYLAEEEYKTNDFNNVELLYTSFTHRNSYFQQLSYHSDIKKLYRISINQYLYPKTIISHLTKPFQQDG